MWGSFTCWKSYPLSFFSSLFFNHEGTRDSQRFCTLHAPGWRRVGGMEGLHIPVGWHQISHQWSGWGEGGNWEKIPHFPSWNRCSNTLSTCFSGHRSFQVPGDGNRLKQWHNQDTPTNPAFICRKKALRDSKTIRLLIELVPHSDLAVSPRWDLRVWDTSKNGRWWSMRTDAAPGQLFTGVGCQNDFCDCPLS